MPRYRATDTIRLDGSLLLAGDVFETTEATGEGLVRAAAAVLVEAEPAAAAPPVATPAAPATRRRKTTA